MIEEWIVEYYADESGHVPVREFFKGLDKKTYARFLWSIEEVRVRNVLAREPLVRHLEGKIWEIREESNTNIYRVLYCFFRGRRIILLHGFSKKAQRLPRKELDIALKRFARFMEQEGK